MYSRSDSNNRFVGYQTNPSGGTVTAPTIPQYRNLEERGPGMGRQRMSLLHPPIQSQQPSITSMEYGGHGGHVQHAPPRGDHPQGINFGISNGQKVPRINGKEVDLYLLYQIVTSHGGWEKVNSRNEWNDLLEHFKLPRSTNGGVAFKNIYLKHLELYEKVHFLGEAVDTHEDPDDDFDDFRHRTSSRRVDHRKSAQLQATPMAGTSSVTTPHPGPGPIPENLRIQHKLSLNTTNTTYDKLILTLQSPLPNEQDVAIGVCTLLSNETKHVIQLGKCPRLVDHLLAHAGVFSHCSLRELTEQVYKEGREYDHALFWKENLSSKDVQDLLCEHFVHRFKTKLGIDLYEHDFSRTKSDDDIEMSVCEPESEYSKDIDKLNSITGLDPEWEEDFENEPTKPDPSVCCASCVCHKDKIFYLDKNERVEEENSHVVSIRKTKNTEQAGLRISQIAVILRNLSFEPGNAEVLGPNTAVQRFVLLCIKCEWSNLSQLAWDIFGNLARYSELKDPLLDPLSSMFISLAVDAIYSCDRFHLLRALEIFTGWFASEVNENILLPYFEAKLFRRICELLGINDIMLLIYTLECMLSMTARGEEVCDHFARVEGAMDTLVSLVTVEAQSYGPKGCIAMRVVETVSTIQPITQALKQQQIQHHHSQHGHAPPGVPPNIPQIQQGMRAAYQQSQGPRYQRPPPIPGISPSTPQKPPGNMCAASTWTPSTSQSTSPVPSSESARPPPHIPNLSPTKSSPPPNGRPQSPSQNSPAKLPVAQTSNAVSSNTIQFGGQNQMQAQRLPVTTTSSEVYHPTFSATTPDGRLSEEGWAMAWLKGAFDQLPGTSVEQGELYRMYCAARKSQNTHLGMDQFILCVKTVYGPSIGPVLKMFGGGTQHSFIEGIRPKLATRSMPSAIAASLKAAQQATHSSNCVGQPASTPASTPNEQTNLQVCVTIPNNTTAGPTSTSPILKATLSRPPRLNSPPGSKKQRSKTYKTKARFKNKATGDKNLAKAIVSPTSSAIRSLLASKVAQRQQKKLQQPETNKKQNSKAPKSTKKGSQKKESLDTTINGLLESIVSATSEECSISSMNSAASSESVPPPVITFEGVLQNGGISSGESSKDGDLGPPCLKEELADIKNQNKLKGMLVDLLERKVGPRDASTMNGTIGNREIRISEKGLEIVDQEGNSNSNNSTLSGPPPVIPGLSNSNVNSTTPTKNEVPCPSVDAGVGVSDNAQQQMTFYADSGAVSSQVTFKGQISQLKNSSAGTGAGSGSGNKSHSVSNDLGGRSGGGGGNISGNRVASNGTDGDNSSHSGTHNCKDIMGDENACSDNARFAPDLIDKFNEISDLIMVSPEQLGIKRSLSSSESTGPPEDNEQPPFKKPTLNNSNGCDSTPPSQASPSQTVETSANPNGATSVEKNLVLENGPQNPALQESIKNEPESLTHNHINSNSSDETSETRSENLPANQVTAMTSSSPDVPSTQNNLSFVQAPSTSTSSPTSASSNSPAQFPVTVAMNHNSNQLSFSRQLVLPSGQPILLKGTNSQTPLQGQVIISKPNNPSNDQIPKAIIILQQQAQSGAGPGPNAVNAGVKLVSPLPASMKHEAGVEYLPPKTQEQLDMEIPYLCEWSGCGLRFTHPQQVLLHATAVHCSERLTGAVRCEWGSNGCDLLLRKRYSLMTHLQDRHCSKPALEMALYRRKNKIEPPLPPQQPAHHPGYAPNAAFHAIRRHALQFMSPRELQDDNEGPVTKSIRLSAALILRNITMYSSIGRRKLRHYESHLANIGMSNVESSRTIAHILNELNLTRLSK